MDEKMIGFAALVGAATVLTRGARPAAKAVMKGVVAVADATVDARDSLGQLYNEARTEYHADRETPEVPSGAAVAEPNAAARPTPPARRPAKPRRARPASSPGA